MCFTWSRQRLKSVDQRYVCMMFLCTVLVTHRKNVEKNLETEQGCQCTDGIVKQVWQPELEISVQEELAISEVQNHFHAKALSFSHLINKPRLWAYVKMINGIIMQKTTTLDVILLKSRSNSFTMLKFSKLKVQIQGPYTDSNQDHGTLSHWSCSHIKCQTVSWRHDDINC